ncbi:cell surface protein SprA [Porphyromonas pogonae]|uniref:T9SS outer membrane translocon Sov/SprA n=1 Tax=Porphyromonas pogonae TaxID=867595 RepID=UPI002E77A98A|nr:cell surface protein SprA [Porphyromonas pogonae]
MWRITKHHCTYFFTIILIVCLVSLCSFSAMHAQVRHASSVTGQHKLGSVGSRYTNIGISPAITAKNAYPIPLRLPADSLRALPIVAPVVIPPLRLPLSLSESMRVFPVQTMTHPTMKQDGGILEEIFGEGGFKIKLNGTADFSLGMRRTHIDNPAISTARRTRKYFNFQELIRLNAQASLGTRLKMDINYDTEATFDREGRRIKLSYTGEEDDIIKFIDVGDIFFRPRNSLINGGGRLFGIHSKLQFGKLDIDIAASQQHTQRRQLATRGGKQTQAFELQSDGYDENRHFFLGHYFYDHFDRWMAHVPVITSGIRINRIEVWVTNKTGKYDNARNVAAFSDLGEPSVIFNSHVTKKGEPIMNNFANTLYEEINSNPSLRRVDGLNAGLSPTYTVGTDYEKVENARLLTPNEYILNPTLGYLSLNFRLNADECLAVAYEYTYQGRRFQVGEFTSDRPDKSTDNIFVKLLKGSLQEPRSPYWHLMMKNIYNLGSGISNVQHDGFKLDILYRSDDVGNFQPSINAGKITGVPLLRVLGLDRLDSKKSTLPDGAFDFLEGITIIPEIGAVVFPSVAPFGSTLADAIGQGGTANQFAYTELYDKTLVEARQAAEKNKFIIKGEYRSSTSGQINLGAVNLAPGSVRISAGAKELIENVDYSIDYQAGIATILNTSLLNAGTPLDISVDNESFNRGMRKTVLGVDLNYHLNDYTNIGATVMHLSEMPLSGKTMFGEEAMKNTLWGLNINIRKESRKLTSWLDKLPFYETSEPSLINFNAEFAQLLPGHYSKGNKQGYSYLDDFESSQSYIDLINPYGWMLSSVPFEEGAAALFPEASLTNDLRYGMHRSHIAWFMIDPIYTGELIHRMPPYMRNDPDLQSNHYSRMIRTGELFPYKEINYNRISSIPTLNISYYPRMRGAYNLDADAIDAQGNVREPEKNFGGIMRRIEQSDFEAANIEYVEFWLLDPFIYNPSSAGGSLIINLGDVSEDVLKDGKKFFENGLPVNKDESAVEKTVWGKVPKRQSSGYAFDNTAGARAVQDVGLNGISTEEEKENISYAAYVQKLRAKVRPSVLSKWEEDKMSPLNDPAGDNFKHYRNNDFDKSRSPILDRYLYYNGTEGNSAEAKDGNHENISAAKTVPDIEDINQDNILNETERYYKYKIRLVPADMRIGSNYITDIKSADVKLPNGATETVNWYQFKVPINHYDGKVGSVSDFKSIRFMRLFLTGFRDEVFLRFASLRLVRNEWRIYNRPIDMEGVGNTSASSLELTTVNLEENADRRPVNYVLPPDIDRQVNESGTGQNRIRNEQSLSLKISNLTRKESRAVYKNVNLDLRKFKKLELFVHAEQQAQDHKPIRRGDLRFFIRMGSDYRHNYYEYSIPMEITEPGTYSSYSLTDREKVWPVANKIYIDLNNWARLKSRRNGMSAVGTPGADFFHRFTENDPAHPENRMTVKGNPGLGNVRTIMMGVTNSSDEIQSVEVWTNELRLSDFADGKGWAVQADMNVKLADLGDVSLAGQYMTAGFGGIDRSLLERSMDDRRRVDFNTNLDLGKLFPQKAHLVIPFFYSSNAEHLTPEYNPWDDDIKLKDALAGLKTNNQRDSLRNISVTDKQSSGFAITNARVDIRSKTPMPYDPANLSFTYSQASDRMHSPDIEYENQQSWRAGVVYDYVLPFKALRIFDKENKGNKTAREFDLKLWPEHINIQSFITRNYQEQQIRNITPTDKVHAHQPVAATFMQQFSWNRRLSMQWRLIRNLTADFNSGTDALIEEPYMQVNRKTNPDGYKVWKDSVLRSIMDLGKPMHYDQTLTVNYTLPTESIRKLNWITSQTTYTANYSWERGPEHIAGFSPIGNTVRNQLNLETNTTFDLQRLYRKYDAYNELERSLRRRPRTRGEDVGDKEVPMGSLWLKKLYRSLFMIKDVKFSYAYSQGLNLPGFRPDVRDVGGQGGSSAGIAPGIGYALGFVKEGYVRDALQKGWLITDNPDIYPANYSRTQTLDWMIRLEPFPDLKITLRTIHSLSRQTQIRFAEKDMSSIYGGNFMMTTIGLKSFFGNSRSDGESNSRAFENFLNTRGKIMSDVMEHYRGRIYPNSGFIQNTPYAGQEIKVQETGISENSPEVLIPSFLSAYTSSGDKRISIFNPLPGLLSALPNWNIRYSGLGKIDKIKNIFSDITLSHYYTAKYIIGNYTSYSGWVRTEGHLGLRPMQGDNGAVRPIASGIYSIPSVTLQESFFPLFGVDMTTLGGFSFKLNWNKNRGVTLNLNAYQILEEYINELSCTLGYKVNNFDRLLGLRRGKKEEEASGEYNGGALVIRANYSLNETSIMLRKIQERYSVSTNGSLGKRVGISADYDLNKYIMLRAFYECEINRPRVSTIAFPVKNTNYGVSLRLNFSY